MVNKATLIGNVGKDPEIINTDGGLKIAKLSLATSEKYNNKQGEKVSQTEWHNLTVFGKLSEVFEKYVKKGDKIYVEGKLKTDKYEKDGVTRYSTSIIVRELQMLGGVKDELSGVNKSEVEAKPETKDLPKGGKEVDDDLPF